MVVGLIKELRQEVVITDKENNTSLDLQISKGMDLETERILQGIKKAAIAQFT